MSQRSFLNGIKVAEVEGGLLVQQSGEAYVARNWRLTPPVEHLIETALANGFKYMIRFDHPRRNFRFPNTRGVVYLAFSPIPSGQWSVAIDTFHVGKGDYGRAVFNGKYLQQFRVTGIPFTFEKRNKSSGHLVVSRDQVIPTLKKIADFDHSVLSLNRTSHDGPGFSAEYVIQREVLVNWPKTPWSERYDVVRDEFPVDGGLTSRRIDILAKDRLNGDLLVLELKRAEARPESVHQVVDYLLALGRRDEFGTGRIIGVLVAERIPQFVRSLAHAENVATYEISWPLQIVQVA